MKLFFHPFIVESKVPSEPVRMSCLEWVVLNEDWKLVRGFRFVIDPTDWEMTGDGAINEAGDSFNRMVVLGHPIEKALQKFISDHDQCNVAYCIDAEKAFEILIYEAKKAGVTASTRITDRRSAKDKTDQPFDLKNGIRPLVEFYTKQCPSEFETYSPETSIELIVNRSKPT
jgi:hypothetical protein